MRPQLSRVVGSTVLVAAVLPSAILILSSFSGDRLIEFPPRSVSIEPYVSLLSDTATRSALIRSLLVGVMCVAIAVPAGTLAAVALHQYKIRMSGAIHAFLILGLVSPLVVSGVAYLLLADSLGLTGQLLPVAVAIATVSLPFVVTLVTTALDSLSSETAEAARTLGAEGIQTFLFVTLPTILPGVISAALLTFIFGITEFLISMILTSPTSSTLPVVIFGSIRTGLTPRLAAAGGLYVALAVTLIATLAKNGLLNRFFFRED